MAERARRVTNEGDGLVGSQGFLNQLDRVRVLGQVPHWAMTARIEDGVEILWRDAVEADRRGNANGGSRRGATMRTALVIILLLAILAGAVFVGYHVAMPAWGWLMMGLGIFFTLLVGGGLMALVFYSSRAGFDEPPEVVQEKKHRATKWTRMIPRRKKRRSP